MIETRVCLHCARCAWRKIWTCGRNQITDAGMFHRSSRPSVPELVILQLDHGHWNSLFRPAIDRLRSDHDCQTNHGRRLGLSGPIDLTADSGLVGGYLTGCDRITDAAMLLVAQLTSLQTDTRRWHAITAIKQLNLAFFGSPRL